MTIRLVPVRITEARAFVQAHHRHHDAPLSGLFAVGAAIDGSVAGVAIVGRPVSRMLDDGWTVEVTRLCSLGERNVCSLLYGACRRAALALGYTRGVTYTLASEPGSSLRASGWSEAGEAGGGSWSRDDRVRDDHHPREKKTRWEFGETPGIVVPRLAVVRPDNGQADLFALMKDEDAA